MNGYRVAGLDLVFPFSLPELAPFERPAQAGGDLHFPEEETWTPVSITEGWVAGAQRRVEACRSQKGFKLKVDGCGDYFIPLDGRTILKKGADGPPGPLDRQVILGPGLVWALALRGVWGLHCGAALFGSDLFVFLGESGQGKSTLAAYLSQSPGWRPAADDILPIILEEESIFCLPHFPQLKVPVDDQPGAGLPERLPLKRLILLIQTPADRMPQLIRLSPGQTAQALLTHIAGTRMFPPDLLSRHLDFSTRAARLLSGRGLVHPHRRDTLPLVREFLEGL